jgi:hypothetical protein
MMMLYLTLTVIITMNLLIAMMGSTYDEVPLCETLLELC